MVLLILITLLVKQGVSQGTSRGGLCPTVYDHLNYRAISVFHRGLEGGSTTTSGLNLCSACQERLHNLCMPVTRGLVKRRPALLISCLEVCSAGHKCLDYLYGPVRCCCV